MSKNISDHFQIIDETPHFALVENVEGNILNQGAKFTKDNYLIIFKPLFRVEASVDSYVQAIIFLADFEKGLKYALQYRDKLEKEATKEEDPKPLLN